MEWIAYPVPLKEGSRAPGWAMVKVVIDIPAKIRRRCKIFSVFIINHLLICEGNDYQRESQMFYDANSNKSSLLTLLTDKIIYCRNLVKQPPDPDVASCFTVINARLEKTEHLTTLRRF